MALFSFLTLGFLVTVLIFIVSSLPLYFAVKFLRGKTTLLKTVLINLLTGVVVYAINETFLRYGTLIAFVALIWIYHEMFRLKWLKAFIAWVLEIIFVAIFSLVAFLLFFFVAGISLFSYF